MSSLLWNMDEPSGESLANLVPFISVKVENNIVEITGLSGKKLEKDMKKALETSRVASNMFTVLGWRHVRFNEFFALEMVFILNKIKNTKGMLLSKSTCKEVINHLNNNTWLNNIESKRSLNFDRSNLRQLTVSMLKHQEAFFDYYETAVPRYGLKGTLLFGGAGTGKTLAGFGFSLINHTDVTIFVAPKNTIEEVWIDTVEKYFKRVPNYWTSISGEKITGREKYLICHYESMQTVIDAARKFKGLRVTVWLDECHNLSEVTSARTKRFGHLVKEYNAEHTVFASGTPLKAMGREVIPLLRNIDQRFTERTEKSFGKMFGMSTTYAADVVAHRLGITTFVVKKDNVVKVEVVESILKVNMDNGDDYTLESVRDKMIAYKDELVEEFALTEPTNTLKFKRYLDKHEVHLETAADRTAFERYVKFADRMHKGYNPFDHKDELTYCKRYETSTLLPTLDRGDIKEARHVIARYKYPMLVIRGKVLGHVLVKQRIECFSEIAKNAELDTIVKEAKKGVLLFSNYVNVAKAAQASLMGNNINCELVTGETSKDLPAILEKVGVGKPSKAIAATYSSLSTGVPVTVCNVAVFIDEPWRSYIREQAIARIARLGQDSVCYDIGLILDTGDVPNLSSRSKDILEWSKDAVNDLLGEVEDNADDLSQDILIQGFTDRGIISYLTGLFK